MPLDATTRAALDLTFASTAPSDPPLARVATIFARCWPESAWGGELHPTADVGDTLADVADKNDLSWSPAWLTEAGYEAADAAGNPLSDGAPATTAGPIAWTPDVRLARVDDQIGDGKLTAPTRIPYRRRLAGEVALAALWKDAATATGVAPAIIATGLDGGKRGARFRDAIGHVLREKLGAGWTIDSERPLSSIFGLHLRRDVGNRESDVVVINGDRLVTLVSSKWSWRSDRGTEGAQIARLRKYRPDIPYVAVTSEFVRAAVVVRESDEDQVYFLAPLWIGAWLAVNQAISGGADARAEFPTLADLKVEGRRVAALLDMRSLEELLDDLAAPTVY